MPQDSTTQHPSSLASEPALPYRGGSGHVAVDTSVERQQRQDADGSTAATQAFVVGQVADAGDTGLTVGELREIGFGRFHHGRISGALSDLHKAGRLAALTERRGRAHVYVLPEHVEGREVRPFRGNRPKIDRADLLAVMTTHRMVPNPSSHLGWSCLQGDWKGPLTGGHTEHLADVIVEEFGR